MKKASTSTPASNDVDVTTTRTGRHGCHNEVVAVEPRPPPSNIRLTGGRTGPQLAGPVDHGCVSVAESRPGSQALEPQSLLPPQPPRPRSGGRRHSRDRGQFVADIAHFWPQSLIRPISGHDHEGPPPRRGPCNR